MVETEVDISPRKLLKPRHLCGQCPKTFVGLTALVRHRANEHAESIKGEQGELVGEFLSMVDKAEPTNVEEGDVDGDSWKGRHKLGKQHTCDECDRTFNHPSSLMYHKESVHNDGRRFVCSKCSKSFKHKQLLQRHQMVHSDTRPFPCSDCGLRFKTKSNLFNHKVVHTGEKKFNCPICCQQFAHKTSLTLHLRWHKGHRPFKCHVCQKCFTQNGNLREHMRIHTNTKPYACDYCGKCFTTSSQHKLHVKRHTGDRPWKCNHCDRSFLHKDTWRTHERRHTGEKPYSCEFCEKGFAEHWSLKKHLRLHTGEKPYKCNVCGKEFADCSNLTKHRKVHMGATATASGGKLDGAVWNVIRSHLLEDANQRQEPQQDVQQIFYVTYQDPEDSKTLHLLEGVQNQEEEAIVDSESQLIPLSALENPPQEEEEEDDGDFAKAVPEGSHFNLTDEDGNSVHLAIDGRAIELVSMEGEDPVIQLHTADGQEVLVQLPKNQELTEEFTAKIQQAVAEEFHKPKQLFHKSILLPKVHKEAEGQVILTEDMLTEAEIIQEDEHESKRLVADFELDETYKKLNELLASQ